MNAIVLFSIKFIPMKILCRLLVPCILFLTNSWAGDAPSPWYSLSAEKKATVNVQLFLSSTCPHCLKAEDFFNHIAARYPQMHIQWNFINKDKNALLRFNQLLSDQQMNDFSVPSIYICGSRWIGFGSAETTGKDLLHAIDYCQQQIEKNGTLTTSTVDTLRHWANANEFDMDKVEQPPALIYILITALTDAVAPCSFFCFAGFLAFIFVERDRKNQWIAGLLFIIAVLISHYFQQVHTSIFYQILPWLRIPAAVLGLMALYYVVQRYKQHADRKLYFSLAFLMGLIVTAYQQTCIMNWAYVFEQWLDNQHLTSVDHAIYQVLYQAFYTLQLVLTLIIYLALLKVKRFAAWQPRLQSTGLLFISTIAVCLVIYPSLLANFALSLLILTIMAIAGRFLKLT